MDLEIIRVLKIAGRFDLARAAKELNERTPDDSNAPSMDIDGLEKAVAALALLFRKLGSWDAVRAVVDAAAGTTPLPLPKLAIDPALKAKLDTPVSDFEMSVRLARNLAGQDRGGKPIVHIGTLVQESKASLRKRYGFGHNSASEVKELLAERGLSLGMNVQGWTPPTP